MEQGAANSNALWVQAGAWGEAEGIFKADRALGTVAGWENQPQPRGWPRLSPERLLPIRNMGPQIPDFFLLKEKKLKSRFLLTVLPFFPFSFS